jgi:hypothetical protein
MQRLLRSQKASSPCAAGGGQGMPSMQARCARACWTVRRCRCGWRGTPRTRRWGRPSGPLTCTAWRSCW